MNQKDLSEVSASWIGQGWMRDTQPIRLHPIAFVGKFFIPPGSADAVLEVASSHTYTLWVNGTGVLTGPLRAYPQDRFIDRLDIGRFLVSGDNHIAVLLLGPTGVTGYSCLSRSGFFCRGAVQAGGREVVFGSGPDWKTCEAKWITSHGFLTSLPVGTQEHWNLADEPPGWRVGNCEDWENAFLLGRPRTPPWKHLRRRPTPLLKRERIPSRLIEAGEDDRRINDPKHNLALHFDSQKITTRPGVVGDGDEELSNDKANVFLFDLGRTRSIRPVLDIRASNPGQQIEIYYDIERGEGPTCMRGFYTDAEGFSDSVALSGMPEQWEPVQTRGCRFVTVRVAGPGCCKFGMEFYGIDYPFATEVRFLCEDAQVQKIWDISAETLRSSSNDVIVDTCARENVLWTFDACVSGKAAFHTFGETALWRHCLWLIGRGVDEDGIASSVVPSQESFMCMFDQAMRWVISCADYHFLTGDSGLLSEVREPILRFLRQCAENVSVENVFVPPNFSWHWMDWAPLSRKANSLPVNALLLNACDAAGRIGTVICDSGLVAFAQDLARTLEKGVEMFYDPQLGLYRDHVQAAALKEIENEFFYRYNGDDPLFSLHGNILMAQRDPGSPRSGAIFSRLAETLGDEDETFRRFGPGWTDILLQPLTRSGHHDKVLGCLRNTYGRLAQGEYPTWGEHFRTEKFNTAHGWGAVVNSLIVEGLLGLRPLDTGWSKFEVNVRIPWLFSYELFVPLGMIGLKRCDQELFLCGPLGSLAFIGGVVLECTGNWERIPSAS